MYAGPDRRDRPGRPSVFASPQHPYTQRLLGRLPQVGGQRELAPPIPGAPPDPPSCPTAAGSAALPRGAPGRNAPGETSPARRSATGTCRALPVRTVAGGGAAVSTTTNATAAAVRGPQPGGALPRPRHRREAVRARAGRRRPAVAPGRGARRRRRVGLRQVDAGARAAGPGAPDRRASALRGRAASRRRPAQAAPPQCRWCSRIPYQSLNPRMRVGSSCRSRCACRASASAASAVRCAPRALEDAGLRPAERFWDRYPHELSGGQRQRVAIAARAGARARRAGLRRAGLGARRLGARAGAPPAARTCAARGASRCSSSPTTSAWPGRCATASP